jgi:hypothetical protein
VLPVERELKQPAKSLMLVSFGMAAAAAGYGVFSLESNSLLGFTLAKGVVPVFVAGMLGVGALFLRASLGDERCRRCKLPLRKAWLAFAGSDVPSAVRCTERGDASELPQPLANEADGQLLVGVSYCEKCREVAMLEGLNAAQRTRVVSRHAILGPNVSRWIALVESQPQSTAV